MILVCAATGSEAACCLRGLREAGVAGFDVLTTGVGPVRAARALRDRLSRCVPSLVVSSGFAGALGAGLSTLEWVTASSLERMVAGRLRRLQLPPGVLCAADGATRCAFVTVEAIGEARRAAAGHPVAVDMESAALAEVAAERGVRITVLRLVTDSTAHPLPAVAQRLAAALASPGLARLAHASGIAAAVVRAPLRTAAFVRETGRWRDRLQSAWRVEAARGVRCTPVVTAEAGRGDLEPLPPP